MTGSLYAFTPEDMRLLKEVVEREKNRRKGSKPALSGKNEAPHMASEHYVAKVPSGGIPGRAGTGLGSASCDIYSVNPDNGMLTLISNEAKTVYNLSEVDITQAASEYVAVTKTKSGAWLVDYKSDGSCTGTGTDCCLQHLGGIKLEDLPIVDADEPGLLVLVILDGCLALADKGSCV